MTIEDVLEAMRTSESVDAVTLHVWADMIDSEIEILRKKMKCAPSKEERFSNIVEPVAPSPRKDRLRNRYQRGIYTRQESSTSLSVASSLPSILVSSLHMLLEGVAYKLRARKAVCYLKVDSVNLKAIVSTGIGIPSLRKLNSDDYWSQHVLESGIAVNVDVPVSIDSSTSLAKCSSKNMLCFPLTVLNESKRCGVIQFFDKDDGQTSFNDIDEASVAATLEIFSFILHYYPSTPLRWQFDNRLLKCCRKFVPKEMPTDFKIETEKPHSDRQRIFRVARSGKLFIRKLQQGSETLPNSKNINSVNTNCALVHVNDYINKLEDCWHSSVHLNAEFMCDTDFMTKKNINLKEELTKQTRQLELSEASCREKDRLCDEYRISYDGLTRDIRQLVPRRHHALRPRLHFR